MKVFFEQDTKTIPKKNRIFSRIRMICSFCRDNVATGLKHSLLYLIKLSLKFLVKKHLDKYIKEPERETDKYP